VVGARRGAGGSGRRRADVMRDRAEAGVDDGGPAGAVVEVLLHPVARVRVGDARRSADGHEGVVPPSRVGCTPTRQLNHSS
jgi:hypothetical protein